MDIFQSTPNYTTTRTEAFADPNIAAGTQAITGQLFGVDGGQGILSTPRDVPLYQEFVAGLSPLEQQAQSLAQTGVGAYQPFLQQAGAAATGSMGMYDPSSAGAFRDEFTEQVINRALQDISEQGELQRRQLSSQAVRSGAFGGSREGVERALTRQGEMRAAGDISARLRSEGERFAQSQARGAFEDAARRQQQGAGILSNLAAGAQRMGQADVSQLAALGGLSREQAQRLLDAELKGIKEVIDQPYQDVQFATGILSALPEGQTTKLVTAPQDQASKVSQIAGLLTALYGGAKAAGVENPVSDSFDYFRDLYNEYFGDNAPDAEQLNQTYSDTSVPTTTFDEDLSGKPVSSGGYAV